MRVRYFALAAVTIVLGLLVHLWGGGLGPVARDVIGDALWAAMIFWLVSAFTSVSRVARAAIAYGLCVIVELSQLVHSPALDSIRETLVGHLVLGSGFDPRDLAAYAMGVAVAASGEFLAAVSRTR